MAWLREELPLLKEYTYADTAASGLLGRDLQQWRKEHDHAFHTGGSIMKMMSFEILPETRQAIGAFFGCKPEQVALTPNFSIGLVRLFEKAKDNLFAERQRDTDRFSPVQYIGRGRQGFNFIAPSKSLVASC